MRVRKACAALAEDRFVHRCDTSFWIVYCTRPAALSWRKQYLETTRYEWLKDI